MKIVLILLSILLLNICKLKCFEELLIEVSIDEEQENGTLVVDLQTKMSSLKLLNQSERYLIKLIRPCSNIYIDQKNSFRILSKKVDREEVCPYDNNCYFICNLFLQINEEMKFIKLKIEINDINDHKPKFSKRILFL